MIEEHKFGSFVVNGRTYLGDIKIIGDKVRYWSTRKKHVLRYDDIWDLLESQPEIVIIGTGNSGYLEIPADLRDLILGKNIRLFIDVNKNAVKAYNEGLQQNRRLVALFHGTC